MIIPSTTNSQNNHIFFFASLLQTSVYGIFLVFVLQLNWLFRAPFFLKFVFFIVFHALAPLAPLTNDRPKCVPLAPRLTQAASKFPPQLPIKLFFHPANFPGEMSGKYFIGNFQNRNRFMVWKFWFSNTAGRREQWPKRCQRFWQSSLNLLKLRCRYCQTEHNHLARMTMAIGTNGNCCRRVWQGASTEMP